MNRTLLSVAAAVGALMPLVFDSALKGAVLLAVAALTALAMWRASAAARHLVWLVAIVALLIVPVLSVALPQWRVLPGWAASPLKKEQPAPVAVPAPTVADRPYPPAVAAAEIAPLPTPMPAAVRAPAPLPTAHSPLPTSAKDWLPLAWCLGFGVLALRLLAAHILLRRASRHCPALTSPPDEKIAAAFAEARQQLAIAQRVTLLLDKRRTIPVVWGVFRPRLMLPIEARKWSDDQLRSVLLHELAHIKRRDTLVQWLTQIACALHWWNPLVWLAAWRLHTERERACDDLVLASGVRPSAYAEHLLHVATKLSPARWTAACGLAMARKSSLEGRLLAVLSKTLNRRGVTRALTAAALILGTVVAIPLAMLHAADEKWNPPKGAHSGSGEFSTYCVHDGKDTAYVIAYRGDFNSSSALDSHPKTRTWTDTGTLTATKPGIALSFHRTHTAPGMLSLATAPSEGRDLGKPAPPPREFGQKEYELAKGRVFLLGDNGTVRQLDIVTPPVTDRESAEKLAKLIASIPPQEREVHTQPKHEYARTLFKNWQASARTDGRIPGALIGQLAETVDQFIKEYPKDEAAPKLAAVRPRLDASRDWMQAEVIALLDEITAIATAPVNWAMIPMEFDSWRNIRPGQPLPVELQGAAWGASAENGLRAAWLLEPRTEQYAHGSVVRARVLFHNAGKAPIVFQTETWHQADGHKARDQKGEEIPVTATWFTGITPMATFRLAPGEYCEVSGHGIAIGSGKYEEEFSTGSVGAIIGAKVGDTVTLTHTVDAAEGGWTRPGDPKDAWQLIDKYVRERIARLAPMPKARADREQIIRRTTPEILGTLPSAEEIAAFVGDDSPDALEKLAARLVRQRAERQETAQPWSGKLPTGETKFRVLAADPDAAKKPGTATAPGRYILGDGVHLQVSQISQSGKRTNSAAILFLSPDPKKESPHKPYNIALPDGLDSYAFTWERGTPVLWVKEFCLLRKLDFIDPAKVTESRHAGYDTTRAPIPDGLRKALDTALPKPAAPEKTKESQPGDEAPAPENPKGAAVKLTPGGLLGFWRGKVNDTALMLSFHRSPVEKEVRLDVYEGEATIGMPAARFDIAKDGSSVVVTMHSADSATYGTLRAGEAGTLKLELHNRHKGQTEVTLTRDADAAAKEPRQAEARELFDMWKRTANQDGTIPGTFIGQLATEVRAYVKANPTLDSAEKLPKLLPRFVATRDWTQAEAIKLLDDVAYYSTKPIEARVAAAKLPSGPMWRTMVEFADIPVQIAKWGEPKDGLRIGLREVGGQWSAGGSVRVELWLHNSGGKDVSFRTAGPNRQDVEVGYSAIDSEGQERWPEINPLMIFAPLMDCTLPAGHVAMAKEFDVTFADADNDVRTPMGHRFRDLKRGKYQLRSVLMLAPPEPANSDKHIELKAPEFTFTLGGVAAAEKVKPAGAAAPAPVRSFPAADVQPASTRLSNSKYSAYAVQSEKDVNFVLIYQGSMSTGMSETWSDTTKRWTFEGNIHLVDAEKTKAAGKNVDKRVIAVKYTSDAPTKLFLDGKEYDLDPPRHVLPTGLVDSPGRVILLRDEGEPIHTARTSSLRNEKDLVSIGDFAVHDGYMEETYGGNRRVLRMEGWALAWDSQEPIQHGSGEYVAQMRIFPDGRVLALNGGRELKEFKITPTELAELTKWLVEEQHVGEWKPEKVKLAETGEEIEMSPVKNMWDAHTDILIFTLGGKKHGIAVEHNAPGILFDAIRERLAALNRKNGSPWGRSDR